MARMGQGRGVHRVLVGKPEGKRPLGKPGRRWELAQDGDRWRALVSTVMNLRVPKMRGIS